MPGHFDELESVQQILPKSSPYLLQKLARLQKNLTSTKNDTAKMSPPKRRNNTVSELVATCWASPDSDVDGIDAVEVSPQQWKTIG
jgi:hypothetical protein